MGQDGHSLERVACPNHQCVGLALPNHAMRLEAPCQRAPPALAPRLQQHAVQDLLKRGSGDNG